MIRPTPQMTAAYPTTQTSIVATTRRMLARSNCIFVPPSL
jgi:hypothetical protein